MKGKLFLVLFVALLILTALGIIFRTKPNALKLDLPNPSVKDIVVESPINSNVLGSIKEIINIEFLINDGDQNILLPNYDIEVKYKYDRVGQEIKSEKFKTDRSGKFILSTTRTGNVFLQIYSKDFSVLSKSILIYAGISKQSVNLFKGGTLEIRATDIKNKPIIGLTAFQDGFDEFKIALPMKYDSKKGVYLIHHISDGIQELYFKANGYQQTPIFKIHIEPMGITPLNLCMSTTLKLFLDLDLKEKPEIIYIDQVAENNDDLFQMETNVVEIAKNKKGLYEYDLPLSNISKLKIYVFKYNPVELVLDPKKVNYKISLEKNLKVDLRVIDEKEKSIAGANIFYRWGINYRDAVSDKNGIAELYGADLSRPNDSNNLFYIKVNVSHDKYKVSSDDLELRVVLQPDNTKIIKPIDLYLSEINIVSGSIKFENKFIMNAKVALYESSGKFIMDVDTDHNGSYQLKISEYANMDNLPVEFYLVASNYKYGVIKSPVFNLLKIDQTIDLSLVPEKSLTIKLKDKDDLDLPNKKLIIRNKYYQDNMISINTNDKSEAEIFNLPMGEYEVMLEDDSFEILEKNFVLPIELLTVVAIKKDFRQYMATSPNGDEYEGKIKIRHYDLDEFERLNLVFQDKWEIYDEIVVKNSMRKEMVELKKMDGGNYYWSVPSKFLDSPNIEVPGFVPLFLEYEGVDSETTIPIKLETGKAFKVKVVDFRDNKPLPFIKVGLGLSNLFFIQTMQTNALGEITFTHVNNGFTIKVFENYYLPFESTIDIEEADELLITLMKGGQIKTILTLDEDIKSVSMQMNSSNGHYENFEICNNQESPFIFPDEYNITLTTEFKNEKEIKKVFPIKVSVENEKTSEIDLDKYQKQYQGSLEVFVDIKVKSETYYKGIKLLHRNCHIEIDPIFNSSALIKQIPIGEYLAEIIYDIKLPAYTKKIKLLPNTINRFESHITFSNLNMIVKNEEGLILPNAKISIYSADNFKKQDVYTDTFETLADGTLKLFLFSKEVFYLKVEGNSKDNFQIIFIGPIVLEEDKDLELKIILPKTRVLSKIQITDEFNQPLEKATFLIKDSKGNSFQRSFNSNSGYATYTNEGGFLPEVAWPLETFNIIVSKEGYEFREFEISGNLERNQLIQIKLKEAATIQCNFSKYLALPISVGILNAKSELLQKPIAYNKKRSNYFESINKGFLQFTELAAGSYYIGYFLNGSNQLISKQGPFTLVEHEFLVVTSDYKETPE